MWVIIFQVMLMRKDKGFFFFLLITVFIVLSFGLYGCYLEATYEKKQLALLGRMNDSANIYQYFLDDRLEDVERGKELIAATDYKDLAMMDLIEPYHLKFSSMFFFLVALILMTFGYVIYERRQRQKKLIYELDCMMNKHYLKESQGDVLNLKLNELQEYLIHMENENKETKKRMQVFIEDTAHQIKTPLTTLKIYVELSKDQKVKQQGSAQIERMENILEALIDMAKLEAHVIHFHFENNALLDCIEQVMEDIQIYQKDKEVSISWQADDIYFPFDELWLTESILNIVKNAVQCSSEGGQIELSARQLESMVVIKIKDQGPGFSEEEGNHLFDRFYSSNRICKRKEMGMGIGLNIAYEVVKAHHGHILAISHGNGAEFVIELPMDLGKEKWELSPNRKVDSL